jgi:hypothetical protein
MGRTKKVALGACMAAIVLGLAASCGDDDESVSEASADVCQEVQKLATDLQSLASIDANTTVDHAKDLRATLQGDVDAVVQQRGELAEARVDALRGAMTGYQAQIDDLEGSATLGEAAPTIKSAQQGFESAVRQISTESKCTIVVSTTAASASSTTGS